MAAWRGQWAEGAGIRACVGDWALSYPVSGIWYLVSANLLIGQSFIYVAVLSDACVHTYLTSYSQYVWLVRIMSCDVRDCAIRDWLWLRWRLSLCLWLFGSLVLVSNLCLQHACSTRGGCGRQSVGSSGCVGLTGMIDSVMYIS
jgi:hypothetical protein